MKNIMVFLFVLMAFVGYTQETIKSGIRFGVLGGVNFQNFYGKDFNGSDLNSKALLGFHGGVNVQIPLVQDFYFQPGLQFGLKGSKITADLTSATYKLSYIEVPLNFMYKGDLKSGFVMFGFGPYVAYGIKGSANIVAGSGNFDSPVEFKNTVEASDPLTTTYFKALDLGANIFAGYEMKGGLFLLLNTQLGLVNIAPEDQRFPGSQADIKNIGFSLSLGYRL